MEFLRENPWMIGVFVAVLALVARSGGSSSATARPASSPPEPDVLDEGAAPAEAQPGADRRAERRRDAGIGARDRAPAQARAGSAPPAPPPAPPPPRASAPAQAPPPKAAPKPKAPAKAAKAPAAPPSKQGRAQAKGGPETQGRAKGESPNPRPNPRRPKPKAEPKPKAATQTEGARQNRRPPHPTPSPPQLPHRPSRPHRRRRRPKVVTPDELTQIKGLGPKMAEPARRAWRDQLRPDRRMDRRRHRPDRPPAGQFRRPHPARQFRRAGKAAGGRRYRRVRGQVRGAVANFVIASAGEAIQGVSRWRPGLLRRFAPRNDENCQNPFTRLGRRFHWRPTDMAGMVPFDWADPFDLESQLTEEERMIRDAARGFAQSELQPRVIDAFRDEVDAPELFKLFGEAGLLGITIPEEYGCAGAGYVAYGLVAREIERVDSGYRSMAIGPVQPRDVSDPCLRHRGTAPEVPPRPRLGRPDRLLRPDRTRCRLRSRRDAHGRQGGRRRLRDFRQQDLDQQLALLRRLRGLGQERGAWRRDPRLRARKGHEGPRSAEDRRQDLAARQHHRHDHDGRGQAARATRCCPMSKGSRARSAASTARATAFPGVRWAQPSSAMPPRGSTGSTASSSAARSPRPSSTRRSSPTWRPTLPTACRLRSGSAV